MKTSFAVLALVMGLTEAKKHMQKFAVGYSESEKHGVNLKMKGNTLEPFSYAQLEEAPAAKEETGY
jgi:hypothetical protein